MKSKAKQRSRREMKYPLFLLGLVVMIGGGLAVARYAYTLEAEAATMTVGFILMLVGIVLE